MTSVESYFFTFFLTNLAKFSMGTVSFITTVASLVDAFLSWIYGAILNSIKPKKWGRYRSWLILLPWMVPFLYAFQFIKVGDGPLSIAIIIFAAIASHVAWNFPYVAQNKALLPTYILISNILCVLGSYISKNISNKLSTRSTTIYTFIAMAVVMIAANFAYTNVTLVIVLMSVAQFGYGIAYACTPALYADTIIYSEWKTGKNATGWISGLQNVPLKVGVMTRGIIISVCLAFANFSPDIDPASASVALQKGICMAFMIIPACTLIIAALLLLAGYGITREKVEQYQAEIAARG